MLAIGSYSQTTGIYREDNMELLYVLHGQEGGITHVSCYPLFFFLELKLRVKTRVINHFRFAIQVQFSKDGNYLYTGGRKVKYAIH